MECKGDGSECDVESVFGVEIAVGETAVLQALEMCGHKCSSFEFAFVEKIVVDLVSVVWVVSDGNGIRGRLCTRRW